MLHVGNYANNRDPATLLIPRPPYAFANGVFVREMLLYQRFVNDADERSGFVIVRREFSPGTQRDLHDFEIIAFNAARFDFWLFARWQLPLFTREVVIERIATQRQLADQSRLH